MLNKIEEIDDEHLSNFDNTDFNIFDFSKVVKRENVLKLMTVKAMRDLDM